MRTGIGALLGLLYQGVENKVSPISVRAMKSAMDVPVRLNFKRPSKGGKIPHHSGHKHMAAVRAARKVHNRRKHQGR